MVFEFEKWKKNNVENAVFGQAKGLTADEICNGLNIGKSPLQMYAENRGYYFEKVIPLKAFEDAGFFLPQTFEEKATERKDLLIEFEKWYSTKRGTYTNGELWENKHIEDFLKQKYGKEIDKK